MTDTTLVLVGIAAALLGGGLVEIATSGNWRRGRDITKQSARVGAGRVGEPESRPATSAQRNGAPPPQPAHVTARRDELYLRLKGAREKLCLAQVLCDSTADATILGVAIDHIDLVGCTLPNWSRFDMPDGPRDVVS